MDQIINLDRNDDIVQVRSKVEWSDGRRVILVLPRGAKAFQSEHQTRLLHRWADEADVQVALVTEDYDIRERANASGVPVFSSAMKASKARWKWQRDESRPLSRATALDEGQPTPKKPILDQLGLVGAQLVVTLVLFSVALIGLIAIAAFVAPSAHITIYPAATTVDDAREVIVDPSVSTIDQINNTLPGTPFRKEISGTATIQTTKVDTAPADHAGGQVVFTNLAGTKATIPAGTIVETSSGVTVRFTTTVAAELPEGYNSRVTVPISALDPGPTGNVRALLINKIEGPLGSVARVVNTSPTAGGNIREVHLVSLDDKIRLRQLLNDQLQQAAIQRIQQAAGDSTFITPASVQVSVITESFDHLVDDPSDTLSLHIEAAATGIAVDRGDLDKLGQTILLNKVPKGYSVLPNTLQVKPDANARMEGNSIIFGLRSSLQVTPRVNAGDILKGLTGKTPQEAATLIANRVDLAEAPQIDISPSWWPRLPWWGLRLSLSVEAQPLSPSSTKAGSSVQ